MLNYKRVTTADAPPVPSTVSFILDDGKITMDVVDSAGQVATLVTDSQLMDLISSVLSKVYIVDQSSDIDTTELTSNALFIVKTTKEVMIYNESTDTVIMAARYLTPITEYNDILGKPTSSQADISDALAMKHTHDNITALDILGTEGDYLTDGTSILDNGSPLDEEWV